jgi:Zn-dependent M16 (insulinase) family peptidase
LNLDPVLESLRQQIKDPRFIGDLVKTRLLDNPHRVRLTLKPDPELGQQQIRDEASRLQKMKTHLSQQQKLDVVQLAIDLKQRQQREDDPDVLPRVTIDDVPSTIHVASGDEFRINDTPTHYYEQGTNGLLYQQLIIDLPSLSQELLQLLPIYTEVLPEVGVGELNYLETQARQSRVSGGIGTQLSMRSDFDNVQQGHGYYIVGSRALMRNQKEFFDLLRDTYSSVRFDERDRIREIVAQMRARREQSVTGMGHQLAMGAATSGMSPVARMQYQLKGLSGIQKLKMLDDSLKDDSALGTLMHSLQQLHAAMLTAPLQFLLVAEAEPRASLIEQLGQSWQSEQAVAKPFQRLQMAAVDETVNQAWITSTQVNFCSRAYRTVGSDHEDAPALSVLAGFLRNGFLHRSIREQGGAYGGGASFDNDNAAFRFYSYRDPRLEETLNDFNASIDWLLNNRHDWRQVEEGILGVVSAMDKPGSPSGEAKKAFFSKLHQRTPERRQRYRERVLAVTLADLQRVGEKYLTSGQSSTAVVTSQSNQSVTEKMGLLTHRL